MDVDRDVFGTRTLHPAFLYRLPAQTYRVGMSQNTYSAAGWHGTTIIGVKKDGVISVVGDGQVSLGPTVIKGSAKKVRRLTPGGHDVICGFAGSTADGFYPVGAPWRRNWREIPAN